MELDVFIKETLTQIIGGVQSAQEIQANRGAIINPAGLGGNKDAPGFFATTEDGRRVFLVEFDVALSVAESLEKEGGAKISVASVFSAGGGAGNKSSRTTTSRIAFKVPVALPVDLQTHSALHAQREERKRKQEEAMPSPIQHHWTKPGPPGF